MKHARKSRKSKSNSEANKKIALLVAERVFNIDPGDVDERLGSLSAIFHMNIPLYTAGRPALLRVPLELIFTKQSNYEHYSLITPSPFYFDIVEERLSKITQFTSTFLSAPERLQIVAPAHEDPDDIALKLGVVYFYSSAHPIETLLCNHSRSGCIFGEIQHDLILFFAMIVNHLGVSVDYLLKHMDIGCSTLVLDK